MADIDDLLDYAYQKNYAKADAVFNDLIGTKLGNALDQEKIKVAGQVYNDMEEKDFEVDDEEQLTLASDEEEAHFSRNALTRFAVVSQRIKFLFSSNTH